MPIVSPHRHVTILLRTTLLILAGAAGGPARAAEEGAVQHLVLFKFKEGTTAEEERQVIAALDRLPARIPGFAGLQWGTDNSPEKLAQGFTYGAIMTFESAAARSAYEAHPEHQAFVSLALPKVELFAFDFISPRFPGPAEPGRVHHLVFFKFKNAAPREAVEKALEAFAALPRKIPGLLSYQAGPEASGGALARGFSHGFLLTFINERARNDYIPHPAHREFVEQVIPILEEPLVLDFTVCPARRDLFVLDGLEPYRVYQRGAGGTARLAWSGVAAADGPIEARLLAGRRTVEGFDWMVAGRAERGAFEAALDGVPAGGEYTIELRQRDALGNVAAHTEVGNLLVGDIWILAGQSNMEGVGDLADVEAPSHHVHCFTMAQRWELAVEPLHWLIDSPDPVHYGGRLSAALDEEGRRQARAAARRSRTKGAGLGLPFAKELVRRTGVPIGLIASAHGGTSMKQWDPAGRDRGGETLYGSMLKQVRNAGGRVKGVLWYQGESDANAQAAPEFAERYRDLVAAFRRDLESPELPFYFVQIGRFMTDFLAPEWNRIQELQRLAEAEIPGTAMISVIDLPLDDLIHVGTSGLKRAGRRLAKIAHRELYGGAGLERGPRLESVQAEAGGRTIRVSYSRVNGRLLPAEKVEGFSLRRLDGGEVHLIYDARVDPLRPASVLLRLQSALPLGAVLHYGAGLNPVCNLADEEDMAAPVFGPVEVVR
jgi:sialate O-acetylesterase